MGSGVYIKVDGFLDALAEWFDKHISACKTCYHEQTCSCVEQGCVAVKRRKLYVAYPVDTVSASVVSWFHVWDIPIEAAVVKTVHYYLPAFTAVGACIDHISAIFSADS